MPLAFVPCRDGPNERQAVSPSVVEQPSIQEGIKVGTSAIILVRNICFRKVDSVHDDPQWPLESACAIVHKQSWRLSDLSGIRMDPAVFFYKPPSRTILAQCLPASFFCAVEI